MANYTPVDHDPFAPQGDSTLEKAKKYAQYLNPVGGVGGIVGNAIAENPRTVWDQGFQGATFNLGDELQSAGGATTAYISDKLRGIDGGSWGDIYKYAQDDAKKRMAKQLEETPEIAYPAQIVGSLATGGIGGATKSGSAIANSLRSGGAVARIGKAGLLGSATGGLAGFGAGSGVEDRLESGGYGAVVGGVTGAAVPAVGQLAGKALSGVKDEIKSLTPANPKTVEDLRSAARPLYEKFTNSGGVYSGKLTNEIADLAESLKSTGVAGSTKKADEALNEALDFYSSLRGKELSPSDLQKLDQSFADDVGRFNQAGEKNFGRILNNLKYEMRDRAFDPAKATGYINQGSAGSVEALKEANRLYAQSYKAADVEKILAKAAGTENPQTSIRTNLKNLLANDKKMKSYTADEKAVLQEAMKRGATGGLVKLLGGRLTSTIAGAMAGAPMGGVGTVAGAVAGKAAGGVAADVAGGIQANRLRGALETIQSGAPMAKGGLPAVIGSPAAGQLAAPAGQLSGTVAAGQPTPPRAMPHPVQSAPAMTPVDYDPFATETVVSPMSNNMQMPSTNDLMGQIKQAESGGDPNIKNPDSSASGLYQFTDGTWRSAVDKWGRSRGIKYSDKNNPQAQEAMMRALTDDNARILKNKGIEPTDQNVYFAHFMGAPAASKAIGMLGKNAIAARSFPDAASANAKVFFKKDGTPRTIDEVYQLITSKVG